VSAVDPLTKETVRELGPGAYLVSVLPAAVLILSALALWSSRLYPWSEPMKDDQGNTIGPGLESIVHGARELGAAGAIVVTLLVLSVAVLVRPLQVAAIQLLEGYGGGRGGGLISAFAIEHHLRRRGIHAVRREARLWGRRPEPTFDEVVRYSRDLRRVARMNERGERIVGDYPQLAQLFMPTLLGNILRRMETTAGERYALDSLVTYPRLYPHLSSRLEIEIGAQQDALSTGATFVFVFAAEAALSAPLVARWDGWSPLWAVFLLTALLSYRGARAAARRYSEYISTAYDLHRFDMLAAMHRELPQTMEQELVANAELSAFLRAALPLPELPRPYEITQRRYYHPQPSTALVTGADPTSGGTSARGGVDAGGSGGKDGGDVEGGGAGGAGEGANAGAGDGPEAE
jgi:hypothetical protein